MTCECGMTDPRRMCGLHLRGEHGEAHKFLHNWRKRHRIDGRIAGNAMEPMSYKARHDALAAEMVARGYRHNSPLEQPDFSYLQPEHREYRIDVAASEKLLHERCAECAKMARDGRG